MNMEPLHQRIRSTAEALSGTPSDVPKRAALLRGLFVHSYGQHHFPLLGAHGVMWGHGFLRQAERASPVLGLNVSPFCQGLREVGRRIFVDVYTHYHFSRLAGELDGAEAFIRPSLLEPLNVLHAANRAGRKVRPDDLRTLFRESLLWEQDVTVTSGVFDEFSRLGSGPILGLAKRPVVKFSFFSTLEALWFKDFTNREERIEKALKTHDIASRVGWSRVQATLDRYGTLPDVWREADPMVHSIAACG
jgi:hypothetical protein